MCHFAEYVNRPNIKKFKAFQCCYQEYENNIPHVADKLHDSLKLNRI